MAYTWTDFVGNIGVAIIIGCYLGIQLDRMDAKSQLYSALNAIAAVLIIISLCYTFNLSSFIIEIFWLLISLLGLYRGRSGRRRRTELPTHE